MTKTSWPLFLEIDSNRKKNYHTKMNLYGKTLNFFPLQVRTAYAELLERLEDLMAGDAMANFATCSLLVKTVNRREYLYVQGRGSDGVVRQHYLGPHNQRTQPLLERFRQARQAHANERQTIDTLARSLRGARMPTLDHLEWRIVSALAEGGIFRLGGVLVGTIAYRCLTGLLGARLPAAYAMTGDVDIAVKSVPIGIMNERACPQSALDRLEMGFSPMIEIDPVLHGSRFKAGDGDFKVEFLTPLVGRETRCRSEIRQFGIPAIPLRFLDYLIEQPVPAIALGRRPLLVQVPSPTRYAVHKLIVSQERHGAGISKITKDLQQSFELQRILRQLDAEGLEEAFADAHRRGAGWAKRVDAGQRAMIRLFGEVL